MKIYLAGPMSGLPKMNFPMFDSVANRLRRKGHEVVSPADNSRALFGDVENHPGFATGQVEMPDPAALDARRQAIMAEDLRSVLECEVMALLPGWERSTGCMSERRVAETCGRPIYLVKSGTDGWVLELEEEQIRLDHSPFEPTLAETVYADAVREYGSDEQKAALDGGVRTFDSGANRDDDERKHDYEGFLSITAIRKYGAYMHSHRQLSNGQQRDSDNWQNGFPTGVLVKSALRHLFDVWEIHRTGVATDFDGEPVELDNAICGVIFNMFCLLHQGERPF